MVYEYGGIFGGGTAVAKSTLPIVTLIFTPAGNIQQSLLLLETSKIQSYLIFGLYSATVSQEQQENISRPSESSGEACNVYVNKLSIARRNYFLCPFKINYFMRVTKINLQNVSRLSYLDNTNIIKNYVFIHKITELDEIFNNIF
ncbi:Hypothetical_protein [Hexamita inflata]|uniref:Hypothetical_protein n=1 Tax=Hexamita inflata TaxID=28002 RepID=A0AA86NG24_9EUKA|nr:Hypothetical protein HINF_LOCUS6897 [Hexamita inflata]